MAVAGGPPETGGDGGAARLPQVEDAPGRRDGFVADLRDAAQEKREPALPVADVAHRLEALVILGPTPLEEMRDVEDRLLEDLPFAEEERDQQPPHPAVAVEEGMDRPELGMGQADPDQMREAVVAMEKDLQVAQRARHLLEGRRNEGRAARRGAGRADPVLRPAQLARLRTAAAHALHQPLVHFADQAHGRRQAGQPFEPVVHRRHVVDDFPRVADAARRRKARLGGEHVAERALRALDLAGEHGLLAHVHEHEEVGLGQGMDGAVQPAQRAVGRRQPGLYDPRHAHRRARRQRGGNEGPVAGGQEDVTAGAAPVARPAGVRHGPPRRDVTLHIALWR